MGGPQCLQETDPPLPLRSQPRGKSELQQRDSDETQEHFSVVLP